MEYTISVEESDTKGAMNTLELIGHVREDLEFALENHGEDNFYKAKIRIDLCDSEGNIVAGYIKGAVGWCGDEFILTGDVQKVIK